MKMGWENSQESRLLSCWRNRRWKTLSFTDKSQSFLYLFAAVGQQFALLSALSQHSMQGPQPDVREAPHQWCPAMPGDVPPVATCSQPPRAGCGESLCSQTQELHHQTCWAEWSFSSCLAHDRPCSYKQVTSGEASCAAANDTRSLKVVEMNEWDEPSCGCSRLRLAAAGSAVCVSAQARVAPGGGPAWSCCRCRSLLFLQLPPDPITWQVSVEAGTIRCQFAARLAEAPQRCQLPSVMRAGLPCASPEHSWGFGARTGLPCLCDALTATTRAAMSLQDSPDSLMILRWSLRMWMSSFFWWEHL